MKHSYCVHYDCSDMNIFAFWTNKNGTNWTIALARRASFQKHGSNKAHKQNLNESPRPADIHCNPNCLLPREAPHAPEAIPFAHKPPHPARTTHPPIRPEQPIRQIHSPLQQSSCPNCPNSAHSALATSTPNRPRQGLQEAAPAPTCSSSCAQQPVGERILWWVSWRLLVVMHSR